MKLLSQLLYILNIFQSGLAAILKIAAILKKKMVANGFFSNKYPKRNTYANLYACTTNWTSFSKYWPNLPGYTDSVLFNNY